MILLMDWANHLIWKFDVLEIVDPNQMLHFGLNFYWKTYESLYVFLNFKKIADGAVRRQ